MCDDNVKAVEEVYVSVNSLSYRQAWQLLEHQQGSDEREVARLSRKARSDDEDGIDLHNLDVLLQREDGLTQIQRALILGWAGSGKSMISFKVLSDWLNGTGQLKRYLAVIYISGRDVPATTSSKSSNRALLGLDQSVTDDQCEVVRFLTDHSDEVLYVLDGGDEIAQENILSYNSALTDLLLGKGMFEDASLIFTSRPCSAVFQVLNAKPFDRMFSLIGFREEQLRFLARDRLGTDAMQFIEQLDSPDNAQVKAAAQETPLFAAMLIHLFPNRRSIPSSITELYEEMSSKIVQRNAQRMHQCDLIRHRNRHPSTAPEIPPMDVAEWSSKLLGIANGLSHLALDSLQRKRFIFTSAEVAKYCQSDAVNQIGLLTTMRRPDDQTDQSVYTFNHLSWQEYLAAKKLAVSDDFPELLKVALAEIGTDQHTWLFWRFLAGLVRPSLLPELVAELCVEMKVYGNTSFAKRRRYFLMVCLAEQRKPTAKTYRELAMGCLFPDGEIQVNDYYARSHEISSLAFLIRTAEYVTLMNLDNSGLSIKDMKVLALPLHNISTVSLSTTPLSGQCLATLADNSRSMIQIKSLHLHECQLTDDDAPAVGSLLSSFKSLQNLNIQCNQLGSKGILEMLTCIPEGSNLHQLILCFNDLSGLDGELTGRALAKAKELRLLKARSCNLGDYTLIQMLPHLYSLYRLYYIGLLHNKLSGRVLPAIADLFSRRALMRHQSLSSMRNEQQTLTVHLSGTTICRPELDEFCRNRPCDCQDRLHVGLMNCIPGKSTVDQLQIDQTLTVSGQVDVVLFQYYGLKYEDVLVAATALSQPTTYLTAMDLRGNQIEDNGAVALANGLQSNSTLRGLDLSENQISCIGAAAFGKVLSSQNFTLVLLNLSQNPIFSDNAESICCFEELVCHSGSIQMLALSDTSISDCHFRCLSATSVLGQSLFLLDLSKNSITDVGAACLAQAVASSETLQLLSLSQNQVTDDGATELASVISSSPAGKHLSCVWLGDNKVSEKFFRNCPTDSFVQANFSCLMLSITYAMSKYLPLGDSPSKFNDALYNQTQWAVGYLRVRPALRDALETTASCSDFLGFLSLLFRGLRSLFLSHPPRERYYKICLQHLYRILSEAIWMATTGAMKCIISCAKLGVSDELALDFYMPNVAVENTLCEITKAAADSPTNFAVTLLASLAKLYQEHDRPEVEKCILRQMEVVANGELFQQTCGEWGFDCVVFVVVADPLLLLLFLLLLFLLLLLLLWLLLLFFLLLLVVLFLLLLLLWL